VRLDRGGVDRQCHAFVAAVGQTLKDNLRVAALGLKAIVDGLYGQYSGGQSRQRAGLKHVDDAADDAPIVIARRTTLVRGQAWRYPRSLLVRKPEESSRTEIAPLPESLGARESRFGN